jgi:indolepyruvate ferredoxin oxidoreductase alpha subunit
MGGPFDPILDFSKAELNLKERFMKKVMTGNEAIARGAFEAGVKVAAAYPGTPSTEILETIAREYKDIYAEWSPNEKVALEVVIGASLAGARTMASMKHVGVNVAADPLMTLSYVGVNGGLVLVTCDDPELYSSQNEQDNRHYARFAKIPMFEPSDSQEAKDFLKLGFEVSETFDTPVMVRGVTRISHSKGIVELQEPVVSPIYDVAFLRPGETWGR